MSEETSQIPAQTQPVQLSYVSLAGDEVPAPTRANAELLQKAADYLNSVRSLRWSGVGDIFWGLLVLPAAAISFRFDPLHLGLLALGTALSGIGLWIIIRPSPIGMIFDGIILLVVAAWNAMVCEMLLRRTGNAPIFWVIIALAQIYWGIQRLRRYPRFAAAVAMQPSANTLNWLAGLVRDARKAKPRKDAQAVQFVRNGSLVREKWKGLLMNEIGVFVASAGGIGGRRDVVLASKDAVEIVSKKKKLFGSKSRIKLRLRERVFKAQIPADSLQRLTDWMVPLAQLNPQTPLTN
jgi:hypothetical protein